MSNKTFTVVAKKNPTRMNEYVGVFKNFDKAIIKAEELRKEFTLPLTSTQLVSITINGEFYNPSKWHFVPTTKGVIVMDDVEYDEYLSDSHLSGFPDEKSFLKNLSNEENETGFYDE